MSVKFSNLQCKEVICVSDGRRLGFISDIQFDVPEGNITAVLVPGPCKYGGIVGPHDDYCIPWQCIRKIGPDIVLVDTRPEDCRILRPKKASFF